jgi:hypothetical protein
MNIWAVCTYFNFTGSDSRRKNYSIFKKNIKKYNLNLLTVEFSADGVFSLNNDDADVLIQLSDGDIMWQKERLLNIGIDHLPENTDIVLILDTDIVFSCENILDLICKKLETHKAVHCLSSVSHLNPFVMDYENTDYFAIDIEKDTHLILDNTIPSCIRTYEVFANFQMGCAGYAWAFKYETIKNVKLFEYNIIGGGDKISASAFIGIPFPPMTVAGENTFPPYSSYLEKVKKYGINKETVSYVDSPIFDLFHGFHVYRHVMERHGILKTCNFDVTKDLISRKGLPFRFADTVQDSTKKQIIDYFYNRNDN